MRHWDAERPALALHPHLHGLGRRGGRLEGGVAADAGAPRLSLRRLSGGAAGDGARRVPRDAPRRQRADRGAHRHRQDGGLALRRAEGAGAGVCHRGVLSHRAHHGATGRRGRAGPDARGRAPTSVGDHHRQGEVLPAGAAGLPGLPLRRRLLRPPPGCAEGGPAHAAAGRRGHSRPGAGPRALPFRAVAGHLGDGGRDHLRLQLRLRSPGADQALLRFQIPGRFTGGRGAQPGGPGAGDVLGGALRKPTLRASQADTVLRGQGESDGTADDGAFEGAALPGGCGAGADCPGRHAVAVVERVAGELQAGASRDGVLLPAQSRLDHLVLDRVLAR